MQIILDVSIKSDMLKHKMMPTFQQFANVLIKTFCKDETKESTMIDRDIYNNIYILNNSCFWKFETVAELNDYVLWYLHFQIIHSLKIEYFRNIIVDAIHNGLSCYYYEENDSQIPFVYYNEIIEKKDNLLLRKALDYCTLDVLNIIDVKDYSVKKMNANEVEKWINEYLQPINTVEINNWLIEMLYHKNR